MSGAPVTGWDVLLVTIHVTQSGDWQVKFGAGFVLCCSYLAARVVRWLMANT